ncbi:elicitor peptide 6 [Dorcoceras hygrometricum]|uniref:Elicitor peptide 6 n=1 Tax=Dorcoceras hygrometricum TaxID=472368 RepID=A0A2Z7ASA2_9LAMI|nr:elicitor peptide 6 [Dorcoceras hygrometricum]
MAEVAEENEAMQKPRAPFSLQNPCRFFQEVLRALLDCLGFESCSKRDRTASEGTSSSPSSAVDPPADLPGSTAAALRSAPPRPVISPGPGPQTNTNVN